MLSQTIAYLSISFTHSPFLHLAMPTWQELAADKKTRQTEAIPKEWIIALPPADQLDVSDVPAKCGLLTPFELEVTESTDVADLLEKLATGKWSSVDVTRAYYKRAIIAQQLVRSNLYAISISVD